MEIIFLIRLCVFYYESNVSLSLVSDNCISVYSIISTSKLRGSYSNEDRIKERNIGYQFIFI